MEERVTLSHSEWLIMQEIWKRGRASFREICDGVAEQNWSGPAVAAFLSEYEASINFIKDNPEEGAALIEQYGIVPKAAVAQAAIPQANMIFTAGADMKSISSYYEVLFAADPESIGGSIPDDAFYYIAE